MINYNSNLKNPGIKRLQNCVSGEGKYYKAGVGDLPGILEYISQEAQSLRISN